MLIAAGRSTHVGFTGNVVLTKGFSPVAEEDARVLVLGTLPGQISLRKGEYYGQSRNAFWRIVGDLFGIDPGLPYEERKRRLTAARVALWDVCEAAHRPGSQDASIHLDSMEANDFESFLKLHRQLKLICFNGAKAGDLFRRKVLPELSDRTKIPRFQTLPSTSPANAAMPYLEKLSRWSVVRRECETDRPGR
jgi:hypoxanthine-DNA glycosylase